MTRYLPALDQVLPPPTTLRYVPEIGLVASNRLVTLSDIRSAHAWFEELQLSLPKFCILDFEASASGSAALSDGALDTYRLARAAKVIRSQVLGHPHLWPTGVLNTRIVVAIHIDVDEGDFSLTADTGSELCGALLGDTAAAEVALGNVTITAANLLLGVFGRHVDWLQGSGLQRITVELNTARPSEMQTRIATRYLQRVLRPVEDAA